MLSGPPSIMMRRQSFSDVLLNLSNGTFSRSSEADALGSDSLLDQYAANQLRTEYRSDLGLYLLEGERTNLAYPSEALDDTRWANTAPVTPDSDVAPDGNMTADTVADSDAGSFITLSQGIGGLSTTNQYVLSFWVKKDSDETRFPIFQLSNIGGGGEVIRWWLNTATGATQFAAGSGGAVGIGDYWYTWGVGTPDATTKYPFIYPAGGTSMGAFDSAATGSIVCWGAQLEQGAFPSSYVRTTTGSAVRQADTLTFASGDIPVRVLSGKFTQQFRPYAASSDLVSGDEQWLLSVGGGNDGIRIRHDGTNVLLEYLRGGAVITASTALTYSRHQLMSYTLDHSTGDLTVSGATSGNGTTTGTAGSWTAATMRVGGVQGGTNEAYMGLGNLEKAA